MGTPFKILSFCGGGMRGLASLVMLRKLCELNADLVKNADMLAGTSAGAGITAALANGSSPDELILAYGTVGRDFFLNPNTDPNAPAYSISKDLDNASKLFGTKTLADFSQNVLLTSFDVGNNTTQQPWGPVLFNNFTGSSTADTPVADAVVASGAMPGMMASHTFGSYNGLVDGAFVHHDPTLAAVALAVNSGIDPNDIVVICFGTGFMANWLAPSTANWGAAQWQGIASSSDNVPALLINGVTSPILNLCLNGTSTNTYPMLAGYLLPGRFAYQNPVLPTFIPENETDLLKLAELADLSEKVDTTTAASLINTYWPAASA